MPNTDTQLNVTLTFRHTESTDALKSYAQEKLTQCVKKYIKHAVDLQVVLRVEKRDHIVEVNLHSKGLDTSARASTDDLYSAIDKVVDTLDSQLRKHKERILDSKHQSANY